MTGVMQPTGLLLALNYVAQQMRMHGDGVLTGGRFTEFFLGVSLRVVNSNNHQLTWGVMQSALTALRSWMQAYNVWGTAVFEVYDGSHQVGVGTMNLLIV